MDEEEVIRGAQAIRAVLRFALWFVLGSGGMIIMMRLRVIPYHPATRYGWWGLFAAAALVVWLAERTVNRMATSNAKP